MSTQLLPIVGPEATTSILTVQKVKVKDQLLYCEFTEQQDEASPARAFTMQGTELVHEDLLAAFGRLVPHLCLLAEQLTEGNGYWTEGAETLPGDFEPFTVTGFSRGKRLDGVVLVGERQLKGDKALSLSAPFVRFEEEMSLASYPYAGRLETAVLAAIEEVEAALRGKCSDAGRQLALFEQDAPREMYLTGSDE